MVAQRDDPMDVYPSTETGSAHDSLSPMKQVQPKHVSFELLLPQSPAHKARLPMRVNIYPHDTTDSIITTVKNFYGLYERRGVIFEDRNGNTLIARYENFEHGMVVYVRVSPEDPEDYTPGPRQPTASPRRPRPHLDEAFQMLPPMLNHHTRAMRQSPSPGRGRRSASASKRMRPSAKSRANSSHGSFAEAHGDGFSDSEGDHGSVTSSRRSKKEPLASADISVDNIVEGGRRKRAKFDSSVSLWHSWRQRPSNAQSLYRNYRYLFLLKFQRRLRYHPSRPSAASVGIPLVRPTLSISKLSHTRTHCHRLRVMAMWTAPTCRDW